MAVVSGGTTLIDNGALDGAVPTGKLILLSTQTASNSSEITFTSGIDSTYDVYMFKFINIQSGDENGDFAFQVDTGTNTNYNQTITSTFFDAYHTESDSATDLRYLADRDQAQGSSLQPLTVLSSGGSDECENGTLHLYNPSSTTFVKHFMSRFAGMITGTYAGDQFSAGYINTTTAITRIKFALTSGNITSGTIKMYGVG
jgi:hypothetical protein